MEMENLVLSQHRRHLRASHVSYFW